MKIPDENSEMFVSVIQSNNNNKKAERQLPKNVILSIKELTPKLPLDVKLPTIKKDSVRKMTKLELINNSEESKFFFYDFIL